MGSENGNYSYDVITKVLGEKLGFRLVYVPPAERHNVIDTLDIRAFICLEHHNWYGIRKINGKFYKLDSKMDRPVVINNIVEALPELAYYIDLSSDIEGKLNSFCQHEVPVPPPLCYQGQNVAWFSEESLSP